MPHSQHSGDGDHPPLEQPKPRRPSQVKDEEVDQLETDQDQDQWNPMQPD